MINVIWFLLLTVGMVYFLLFNDATLLNKSLIFSINSSFDLIVNLAAGIILWSGIMKIAEDSLILDKFSKILLPLLKRLFPQIPPDHSSLKYIASNIAANALGLGSVATPFGLKAMKELQKINQNKEEASYAMQTFLIINTAGVTIIPSMVITLRITNGSINPFSVFLPSFVITTLSCLFAILINYIFRGKHD